MPSAAMIAHLQSSPTTLCHIWRIEERKREIALYFGSKVNVRARGGQVVKNGGTDGSDDAGAFSIQSLVGNGYFEFRTDLSGTVAAGLSATNSGATTAGIQFCLQVEANGTITIKESGTTKLTTARNYYKAGHLLKVRVETGVVTYWYDRTLLYTSAVTPGGTLYADCSITTTSAQIYKSVFGVLPTVIRLTNHTRNLVYNGETYLAYPLTPTRIARAEGLSTDNLELTTMLNSDHFDKTDFKRGRWNHARLEFRTVNYMDTTMGAAQEFVGYFGQIKLGKGIFTAEIRSLADLLQQEIGEVTGALCRVRLLGDERCGLPMTLGTTLFEATISAVTDDYHFTVNLSPAKADDFFAQGAIYWRTGDSRFMYGEIKSNVGNVLTLKPLSTLGVSVGDTVTLIAGCARTVAACKGFANAENPSATNIENFQGEPDLPGLRRLHAYPE
jgi:uncharacterized phage protein (TIGR02218 family)